MRTCWEGPLQSQLSHLEDAKTKVTAQVTLVTSIFQQCSYCGNDRGKKLSLVGAGTSVGEDQGELPGGGSTELPRQSQQER